MLQPYYDKTSARIVVALFMILLVCSGIYYQQRVLFVDTSWMVFNILNRNNFLFGEYRYGVFITQLVPLIAGYLHLPLKLILFAYSLSFQVFYLVSALLLIFRYRQLPLAILMAFYFTLFVSDAWFWPHNEVHQGVAWMFLFLGIFRSRYGQLKVRHHIFLVLAGFLAIFSHFIVIIPFSFLWIYLLMNHRTTAQRHAPFILYTLYLALVFFLKYRLGMNSWYDGAKLSNVKKLDLRSIWYSFGSGQSHTMARLLLTNYWPALLLLASGLLFALKRKNYLPPILTLAYCAGYYALVCLTYPDAFGRSTQFYMESEWMALGIIAGGLFVFQVIPDTKPAYVHLVLGFILLVRLGYIFAAAPLFTQRLENIAATVSALQRKGISKAILLKSEKTDTDFIMDWGTPVESLIWSSVQDKQRPVTFKIMPAQDIGPIAADSFFSCFDRRSNASLNHFYFRLDSTAVYKIVRYDTLGNKGKE